MSHNNSISPARNISYIPPSLLIASPSPISIEPIYDFSITEEFELYRKEVEKQQDEERQKEISWHLQQHIFRNVHDLPCSKGKKKPRDFRGKQLKK